MADQPPADSIEDLIAECLARIELDGDCLVEAVCEQHPELVSQVREGLERLRSLGMASDDDPVQDTFPERLGDFKLLRRIGAGGMGVVYLAEQAPLERRVALKLIRPEYLYFPGARERFEREIEAVAQLKHPGIVPIYTVGEDQGVPYFAMEWVEGVPLDEALFELGNKAPERLSAVELAAAVGVQDAWGLGDANWVEVCLSLVHRVAQALHHAHERGVIHRDVKPSNILLAHDGRVLLFDFGLALTDGTNRLTRTGSQLGSLPYMSPEQLRGKVDSIDRRTDVYSLGVVLFELLTLKAPYLSDATDLTRKQILEGKPTSIRQLNRAVAGDTEAVCLKAMDLNAERRYQTAEELAHDLANLLAKRPVRARRPSVWLRARRFAQRRPTLSLGVVMSAILFVTALAFAWRERESANAIRQLADRHLLDRLHADAALFWPAKPSLIEAIDRWLEHAAELRARLPRHRRALEALRAGALPYDDDARARDQAEPRQRLDSLRREREGTERVLSQNPLPPDVGELKLIDQAIAAEEQRLDQRRTWDFQSSVDRWQHDQLEQLVVDLDAFAQEIDEVRRQRAVVASLAVPPEPEAARAWSLAIADIADIAASPAYHGLQLAPQFGLTPWRKNPQSGLWEFLHILSGTHPHEQPTPDDAGHVRLDEQSGIVLVLLPGGTFLMGSDPAQDGAAEPTEQPRHEVVLAPFFLAKFELTIAQWIRLGGKARTEVIVRQPTEPQQLSWLEANAVLMRSGLELPTEAQWEYACRAGGSTIYFTGDSPESLAGFANVADDALKAEQNSLPRHPSRLFEFDDGWVLDAPVGSFRPNAFGLYDIVGNVMEWCRDKQVQRAYRTMVPRPGDGLRDLVRASEKYITRGGYWAAGTRAARSAARTYAGSQEQLQIGARPCRAIEQ